MPDPTPTPLPDALAEAAGRTLPPGVALERTLRRADSPARSIGRIAWSPDGRWLAAPSNDDVITVWETASGSVVHRLSGHRDSVWTCAFDPTGAFIASGSNDDTVRIWRAESGEPVHTLQGHTGDVESVAFSPAGTLIASASDDRTIRLWDVATGEAKRTLSGHTDWVWAITFDPSGRFVASASSDATIRIWDVVNGQALQTLTGHKGKVRGVSIDPTGRTLVSSGDDGTLRFWEMASGRALMTLEAHTAAASDVRFDATGALVASKGLDSTIRVWSAASGDCVAVFDEPSSGILTAGLAFHPRLPLLATVGSPAGAALQSEKDVLVHVWSLTPDVLLAPPAEASISYTSAKIVLVGDSGVGKTGLGWRLSHGEFKEHASTHGQQFWMMSELSQTLPDGALREAILWDLAGQPDYRLIHALFLDDADLALVLFDPTHHDEPLKGVEFWLKQLNVGPAVPGGDPLLKRTPAILVAARADRGSPRLRREEIEEFCRRRGVGGYFATSALTGDGVSDLVGRMQIEIHWSEKTPSVATQTFKRIKDTLLDLKESGARGPAVLTVDEIRELPGVAASHGTPVTDTEIQATIRHLANHGYVTRLKTSSGEPRVLLTPELLNNLAASFVLEARRNQKGLGVLEEQLLQSGQYRFPELDPLTDAERAILIDATTALFLEHNVCFRESDPLSGRSYLVFPELINLKTPLEESEKPMETGVSYTVSGAIENVYASLVVLLGYTQTFTRVNQWQNQARYEVASGAICGFRLEDRRPGELDFVLFFGQDAAPPVRTLFQSLFENFLTRRNLTVLRLPAIVCVNNHPVNRAVVREQMNKGRDFAFCGECGERVSLPRADRPIQLTTQQAAEVTHERQAADQRSRFEQALFRVKTFAGEHRTPLSCFISYAWGVAEHERWVRTVLAKDLLNAGVQVILDQWENTRYGSSISRFVERAAKSARVIVVGTPQYLTKYENAQPMGGAGEAAGFVLAAEGDLINRRMLGTEEQKMSVLPLLLAGTENTSLPELLRGRVYADFRTSADYYRAALDLVLDLQDIAQSDPLAVELQEMLAASGKGT